MGLRNVDVIEGCELVGPREYIYILMGIKEANSTFGNGSDVVRQRD